MAKEIEDFPFHFVVRYREFNIGIFIEFGMVFCFSIFKDVDFLYKF